MNVYMLIVISTEEVIYEFLLSTGIGDEYISFVIDIQVFACVSLTKIINTPPCVGHRPHIRVYSCTDKDKHIHLHSITRRFLWGRQNGRQICAC